ncbi:metallophosphoesterase [Candidatus Latescibacterota bacterium]
MKFLLIITFVLVVLIMTVGCMSESDTAGDDVVFQIALIGDIPRLGDMAIEPDLQPFHNLRDSINASGVEFIIHDGDFKSGASPCSDEYFERWLGMIGSFDAPFFMIFGDNEWTDCWRDGAGGYDPLERLDRLRDMFFSKPVSKGRRTMPLERQSDSTVDPRFRIFRENIRWTHGNVMFLGLNVQGSYDNFGRTPVMDNEYRLRKEAVIAYMRETFDLAKQKGNNGIMVTIQANPRFERRADDTTPDAYSDFLSALHDETLAFDGKPVILVHGDSHYFRIDKPMYGSRSKRRIENFTRVETFGAPDNHWILCTINPSDPNLFRFEQRIIKENLIDHLGK